MSPHPRRCSVSVDLDEIACYSAIHGIEAFEDSHAVYDRALARVRTFASRHAIPLTLFVVARDLEREENVAELRQVIAEGHEIGNHSLDHFYDLTRREPGEQWDQVLEANRRIESVLGVRARGFRAPGYTQSESLMSALSEAGFDYDSSVFPCPAYYCAKAAAIFGKSLLGRRSRSVLGAISVIRAPTGPYRVGSPYWTPGAGILELPIQVCGPLRLPFIGTSLVLLGPSGAKRFTERLAGETFVNLELHGIDFLDAHEVPKPLLAVQPDARLPLARKLRALDATLETLRAHGYAFLRLDEVANAYRAER